MKNTFASKKQFHQISEMVAHAFDMKPSRTKHKISMESGYKNANALLASIPSENQTLSHSSTSSFNTNSIERLISTDSIKDDLYETNHRQKHYVSSEHELNLVQFKMPLYLCLIIDGFYFSSQEWLNKTIFESSTHEANTICLSSEDEGNFNMKLSTFQHIIGNYIYNEEELLCFQGVQLEELIYASNLEQYNIIANSKKLHKTMDSSEKTELAARYLRAMVEIQNKYNDLYTYEDDIHTDFCDYIFHSFIFDIKRKVTFYDYRTLEEQLSDFSILSTPLKGTLHNECIENIATESDIFSHIIEFCLGHNQLIDSDFLKMTKSSFQKNENELNDFDFGVRRHFNYCWAETANHFFNKDDHENEFIVSDLLLSLEKAIISNVNRPLLKKFISSRPVNGKYFNPFANESYDIDEDNSFHYNSLLSWIVMNETVTHDYVTDNVKHLDSLRNSNMIQLLITHFKKELEETNFPVDFFKKHLMPERVLAFEYQQKNGRGFESKWVENNYLTLFDSLLNTKTLMEALKSELKIRKNIL